MKTGVKTRLLIILLAGGVLSAAFSQNLFELVETGSPSQVLDAINAGAKIDARNENGWTPLMVAARNCENPEVISILLEAGADVKVENAEGKTAFDYASYNIRLKGTKQYWELYNAMRLEPNPDPFEKLMKLSGLQKQVAEFPGLVLSGIEQSMRQGSRIPEAEYNELVKSIVDAFKPSDILDIIGSEVKRGTSESSAKELLVWYESDLGRRITKAEEDASTPAAYQAMIKEAQTLLADEKRVEFARKLDGLLHAAEMSMQLQVEAAMATFTAISKAMNPLEPVKYEAFNSQMLAQERRMRANVEQLVLISFVYSYKNIELESLGKYLEFNENPITRRFNDGVIKGMKLAFNRLTEKMADALAAKFKKQI